MTPHYKMKNMTTHTELQLCHIACDTIELTVGDIIESPLLQMTTRLSSPMSLYACLEISGTYIQEAWVMVRS